MAEYRKGFRMVKSKVGDRVFRPFKLGWGTVTDIKGTRVKVKWDTGGTRWYPSYKLITT